MALNKTYNRINWQNRPSTSTALGATNLNKMDYALNEVDNRLILLDDGKADKTTVNTLVREVALNPTTGVLTVTLLNGTVTSYDLDIEKVVTNFTMNAQNQLVLTLAGGIEKVIDLSKFIDIYTFSNTQTISMTNIDNTISASVKLGSVTEGHLDTGLMQEIRQKALDAGDSAADSLQYSKDSKRYAVGGEIEGDAEDNAKYYKNQAELFKTEAKEAADRIESITNVSIATTTKAGIVKATPDFAVAADGTPTLKISDTKVNVTDTNNHFTATKLDGVLGEIYTKATATDNKIGTLSSLQTTNKNNVVAAVNECFTNANNGKSAIAAAIGSPATASNTFAEIANEIKEEKRLVALAAGMNGVETNLREQATTISTYTHSHLPNVITTNGGALVTGSGTAVTPASSTLDTIYHSINNLAGVKNTQIGNITGERDTWYNNYVAMEADRNNWMNLANSKKGMFSTEVKFNVANCGEGIYNNHTRIIQTGFKLNGAIIIVRLAGVRGGTGLYPVLGVKCPFGNSLPYYNFFSIYEVDEAIKINVNVERESDYLDVNLIVCG